MKSSTEWLAFCVVAVAAGGAEGRKAQPECRDISLPIDPKEIDKFGVNVVSLQIEGEKDSLQCFKVSHDLESLPPIKAVHIEVEANSPHLLMSKFFSDPTAFNYDVVDFCSWLHSEKESAMTVIADGDPDSFSCFEAPLFVAVWWKEKQNFLEAARQEEEDAELQAAAGGFGRGMPPRRLLLRSSNGSQGAGGWFSSSSEGVGSSLPVQANMTVTLQFELTEEWKKEHMALDIESGGDIEEPSLPTRSSSWGASSSSSNDVRNKRWLSQSASSLPQQQQQQQQKPKPKPKSTVHVRSGGSSGGGMKKRKDNSCHYFDRFVDLHTLMSELKQSQQRREPETPTESHQHQRHLEEKEEEKEEEKPPSAPSSSDSAQSSLRELESASSSSSSSSAFPFPEGSFAFSPPTHPPFKVFDFEMTGLRENPQALAYCRKTAPKSPTGSNRSPSTEDSAPADFEEEVAAEVCGEVLAPSDWRQTVPVRPGMPTFILVSFASTPSDVSPDFQLWQKRARHADGAGDGEGSEGIEDVIAQEGIGPNHRITPVVTVRGLSEGVKVLGLLDRAREVLTVDSRECLREHVDEFRPWLLQQQAEVNNEGRGSAYRALTAVVDSLTLPVDNYGPSVLSLEAVEDVRNRKGTVRVAAESVGEGQGVAALSSSSHFTAWLESELKECRGQTRRVLSSDAMGGHRGSRSTRSSSSSSSSYMSSNPSGSGRATAIVLLFSDKPEEVEVSVAYWLAANADGQAAPSVMERVTVAGFIWRLSLFALIATFFFCAIKVMADLKMPEDEDGEHERSGMLGDPSAGDAGGRRTGNRGFWHALKSRIRPAAGSSHRPAGGVRSGHHAVVTDEDGSSWGVNDDDDEEDAEALERQHEAAAEAEADDEGRETEEGGDGEESEEQTEGERDSEKETQQMDVLA
uniref:Transmembrane protein n=1 Tax=Chromera velia CCMP2878 TaxID=1169474 RepID=A0A0G4HY14_9ALVE|eukprot:Cvel_1510.t1-p1 / transcript=Cvel_1510.t1 / gene=Cvel_1510 / organism=Chromera_velia_CCMP2878 / gene_product=hypothetical protein / transcript_product=hypothetical protein / location=Cvel_scaffold53:66830-71813(-) / protein_length=914 / sequence_SO=supercontig / SO=protein_coding / is_pseudo=false